MKIGVREGRINDSDYTTDIEEILTHLGLYANGMLNHAAMILYGKNLFPKHEYSHSFIRMGRFLDEGMDEALDSKQMAGNAFEILDAAVNFVSRNLPIASYLREDSFERVDEMALPPLAVREAIINAICHRDYSKGYGDIAIKIFNTHLEIHNIGILYGSRKIEDLDKPHASLRRNKLISNAFFCRKLIDQWGSGISRIQKDCSSRKIPIPAFSEYSGGIAITFKFKAPIGPPKISNKKVVSLNITERQKQILALFQDKEIMSIGEIITSLKDLTISERTLRRDLEELRNVKLLISKGFGRKSKWLRVIKK